MLSQRVRELEASATLEMNARRLALEKSGKRVFNFSVGEPDFDTPEFVCEAAKRAIDEGWTRYTPVAGVMALREAVAEATAKSRGVSVAPEEVLITCGAKHALSQALLSQVDRGDEVLVPAPYWVSYPEMVRICEGLSVVVPATVETDFKVSPAALERVVSPRTVGLLLNSPSNPTGAVYTAAEIEALVAFAAEHDLWILSDEIYEHFTYDCDFRSVFTGAGRERTILVSGVSKSFAMTGWRIGWAVADPALVTRMTRLQAHTASNAAAVSQAAALAALTGDGLAFVTEMVAEFAARRDLALGLLDGIAGVRVFPPGGAFYVFLDLAEIFERPGAPPSSQELCLELLSSAGVALVPGEAFGVPASARMSFACSEAQIDEGLAALGRYLDGI